MVKPLTNPFSGRPTPLGSLLTAAGKRLADELDHALSTAGFDDIRAAHAPVFMSIDPDGSRMTELASRTKMTKQAVGELIRYLADRGYLTVGPHLFDRRAKLVELTAKGWDAIAVGEQVINTFDHWLEQLIGPDRVSELRHTLTTIADTDPTAR